MTKFCAAATQQGEGSMRPDLYAPGWQTFGWSRDPDGKWIELGGVAGITIDPPAIPPTLGVHDVAGRLNEMESEMERARR